MAKRKKSFTMPKVVSKLCIVTGFLYIALQILNKKLKISLIADLNFYIGSCFAISLLVVLAIFLLNLNNGK